MTITDTVEEVAFALWAHAQRQSGFKSDREHWSTEDGWVRHEWCKFARAAISAIPQKSNND